MYKYFLSIILLCLSLNAQEIGDLLKDYQHASDLSNKTKNENAGNLIVYTRDDLERMQALSLKDLIKSLRFYTYSEERLGRPDLLNLDAFSNNSKGIRVYLNEHELLSPLLGSGFTYFGDIELEFIDHVEIYTGFPSFEFGIEPATVVIRLYSKSAKHDEGGKVKALVGSNSSHQASAYYAQSLDELSYFAYMGQYDNNRKSYNEEGSNLQRDQQRERFFGSLSSENHSLNLHAVSSENDAFLGRTIGTEVISNDFEYKNISISSNSRFMDDTLKLNVSYSRIDSELNENYNLPELLLSDLSYNNKTTEESLTLLSEKKWRVEDHLISLGLQYRYKYFDLTDSTFNNAPVPFHQAFNTEQIYSVYLQDLYSLNENHVFSFSIMDQFYRRNGEVNEPSNLQLRLGYTYNKDELSAKTTLSAQSFAAEPYTIVSSGHGNVNLKSERYYAASQELTYRTDESISNFLLGYSRLQEYPLIGPSGRPENSDKALDVFTATIEYKYLYSQNDSLEFNLNYSNADSAFFNERAKILSALLRGLNTFGELDLFNEFVIYDGAFDSSIRVDYSLGGRYKITPDLSFNLKGENLFDRSIQRSYINGIDPITNETKTVEISIIDRKLWFGLEYLF